MGRRPAITKKVKSMKEKIAMKDVLRHLDSAALKKLYNDFTTYRDKECGGWANMSVQEFYLKNRANYA